MYIHRRTLQPYVGNYIYINKEGSPRIQAFVSKYSNPSGSEEWYNVPSEWNESGRSCWELVAFRNKEDTHREGAYVYSTNATVNITIKSITHLEIVCSPKPYAVSVPLRHPPFGGQYIASRCFMSSPSGTHPRC